MTDVAAPLLTVTDAARARVLEVRGAETDPEALALWLEVTGSTGTAYTYDMYFRRIDEAGELDIVQHGDDLSVVVPSEHVDKIRGATLDLSGGGMVLQNPNAPQLPPMPELDLDDPLVAKVVEVLAVQVNPAIASHGGFAELVAIEETRAAPADGRRLPGLRDGRGHAVTGDRGRHPRRRPRDHRGRRHHRPRRWHEPLLRRDLILSRAARGTA